MSLQDINQLMKLKDQTLILAGLWKLEIHSLELESIASIILEVRRFMISGKNSIRDVSMAIL